MNIGNEAIRERNWHAMKGALTTYFVLGVALMLLTPDTATRYVPGLAWVLGLSEALVPGIARMSRISPFPEAMGTTLAVLWSGFPIVALRMHRSWTFNPRLFHLKKSDLWFVVAVAWFIAAMLLVPLYFFFDVSRAEIVGGGGRGGWMFTLFTQYRLGAALIGPTWFCAAAMWIGISTSLTRYVSTVSHGHVSGIN